jgi:hypothetical protein
VGKLYVKWEANGILLEWNELAAASDIVDTSTEYLSLSKPEENSGASKNIISNMVNHEIMQLVAGTGSVLKIWVIQHANM